MGAAGHLRAHHEAANQRRDHRDDAGGEPIKGDYKFTDEFPMADGFEENVEFFTLTYEAPLRVSSNREFARIAPLLWMRAGSQGRRIDDISTGWDVADAYGVLADLDQTEAFLKAIAGERRTSRMVFVVTDEDRLFASVCRELPEHVEAVRLYEAYLRNFEIEAGGAPDEVRAARLPAHRGRRGAGEPRAREGRFHRDGENSSFSLTATTGAGKTVMAAAAIEALFYGNRDVRRFEPDPSAVVIWFSDDPALNLQTRDRLMQASEKFNVSDLVVIEPPFSKPKLEPGKVYFLNTGKLARTRCSPAGTSTTTRRTDRRPAERRRTCRGGRSGRRSRTRSRTRTGPST